MKSQYKYEKKPQASNECDGESMCLVLH
jgi:hypothetical protein